ncbi:collagen alpha-4(VI) chain-like isoform X2 [Crotalus tigris]|uniref:collagen alpha-4(VI) chain-like isoform X2 n=1 Tax=Crotalus tigris TaxID=88082 RepID=UPI00192F3412|nr:collagen alpha-4(VI) chain-like isoform X2 [Crotalus tigris]
MNNWSYILIVSILTTWCCTDAQATVCREASVADIVFMVDGSWSIGPKNFRIIQDFLYTLVNSFDIGKDKIQVGMIQYSDDPRNEFLLNFFHQKKDILKKIQNLIYKGGGTKTGKSLKFLLDEQFSEMAGSRHSEGVPQIAVVITDGQSQDNFSGPAEEVKNAGIILYAIGIKDAILSELQEIASDPEEMHVYNVEDFASLQGISQNILQVLCTTVEEASQEFIHIFPVCRKATVADIVFLVDSSSSIDLENFQKVKSFLYNLISNLFVGHDQIRIGLAQYSDEIFSEFHLNQYPSKNDILEHIENLTLRKGSTYTGAALDFIKEEYFTESAGSRIQENIPQVLVLLTDGESHDEVKVPARKLKNERILIYVVGIGIQNTTELMNIANQPFNKFLFNVDNFDILQDLINSLLETMCFALESQIKAFTKRYADIVFLLDSSNSMGSANFEKVKKVIVQIVEQLDIGSKKYQIGLAQYSEGGKVEFLLNRYKTKKDILNHIQQSTVFMGGPLKTGSALRFLREVYFVEKAGSRLRQGTPQFTVIFSSAKSEDDVKKPAKELKEMGVNIATVDVLHSDKKEMKMIATSPLVYQIDDIEDLVRVQKIIDIVEAPVQQEYEAVLDASVPAVCSTASVADIVFLVDESTRIGQKNFQLIRTFLLKIINALEIASDDVRVALVLYSDKPRLEFSLNTFEDKSEVMNYLKRLPYRGGQTYTGAAIDFLKKKVFTKRAGSRKSQGVQQLAVVITDGQSLDDFTVPASKLRRAGVTVYAVGIQNISASSQLYKIASYPPRKHVTTMEYFLQLSNLEYVIKKQLCNEIVSQAFSIPVQVRSLKEGCEETEEADIYFLIDSSGSIQTEEFHDMKVFMNEVISMFQIGPNQVRFGVVQYASAPSEEFLINQYNTLTQLKEAIKAIWQIGGGTKTGYALQYMKNLFKTSARDNVPQFLIVITDGESQDQVTMPAEMLRNAGIVIYAIGVKDAAKRELEDIAGTKDRMFFVNDFDSLKLIKHDIAQDICSPEACKNLKADIILLIDTSESMDQFEFEQIKDFIDLIVNKSDIGTDKIQIGLLQFGFNPEEVFPLNKYNNKADLRKAITTMRQVQEGARIGRALDFASLYFDTSEGGRLGVKQYLIVVTDEESSDDVRRAARALRKKGVIIYAIGILKANNSQLLDIAGTQDKVFSEDYFQSLVFLVKPILFQICNPEEACGTGEADLVFLIDGSDSISKQNFSTMKTFMKEVVDSFIIAKDKVRIGVAQYSTDPQKEFYLNEFFNNNAIKKKIDAIAQLKGHTFTGAGLKFVRSFFESANGGRQYNGVVQYLIVITDGRSDDKVEDAAIVLRKDGVQIFVIGIGTSISFELQKIAGFPSRVYVLEDFEQLQSDTRKIVKEICNPGDKPTPDCEIDISIGVDISEPVRSPSAASLKEKIQAFLPQIIQQMSIVNNISCTTVTPDDLRFRYQVYTGSSPTLFDSGFESYSDEIFQKFWAVQTTVETHLTADFLQSFWDRLITVDSANVKALLIFSDGPDDRIDVLKTTVDGLRGQGLNAFWIVALKHFPEYHMLQELEFGRGFSYREPLYFGNPELPSMLRRTIDTIIERECCKVCCKCFGEDGIQGIAGYPGNKGKTGFVGYSGHPGEEGGIGNRGLMGSNGTQGEVGCSGARGPKGVRGYSGKKGEAGNPGIDGIYGQEGEQGVPGSHGQKGHSGRRGREGPRGEPGEPGQPGARGDSGFLGSDNNELGPPGKKGNMGQQGEPGDDGEPGEAGESGANGLVGQRGPPGLMGELGNEGNQGYPGEAGLRGQTGVLGLRGIPGPLGPHGLPGHQGNAGIKGESGAIGKRGHVGPKGEQGDPGEKGQMGLPGTRGFPGIDGSNGYGLIGRKGTKGLTGYPGNSGRQGEIGDPGNPGNKGAKGIKEQRARDGTPGKKGNPGSQGPPGRMGSKGPKGTTAMTTCQLVNLTRGNCPCCVGKSKCPVYPTEVVFALDMSEDVTPVSFERMKDIMKSLLKDLSISRSNCPTGARISVLSYNTNIKYLIRFSDFQRKDLLMEAVQGIPLERSSGQRNIGRAMRFVARNAFKRHRQGALIKKVAVFLTAGPSQDAASINTAVLEFSGLDIIPTVIALRETSNVREAFLTDDTGRFKLFVWESKEEERLNYVSLCSLCYDTCNPVSQCEIMDPPPININMDIAYIMDGSRDVSSEEFETMKEFMSNMLDYFAIASLPLESDKGARVALVQHAPRNFSGTELSSPVSEEFDLTTYSTKHLMKTHIQESLRQLEGPSAVGHALEWTINNVFLGIDRPRKHKVIFTMLGSKTSAWDREKLLKMSLEAKCQGFTMFTLALGSEADDSEMTELSSVPVEQHLLHMGRADKLELPYALRFSKAFLNLLKRELNIYPPIILQEKCDNLHRGDTYLQAVGITDRILFSDSKHNDLFQPSELSRKNVQNKMLKTTQGPREEQYGQIENKYFTSISIQNGDGTETEELFEKLQRAKDACSKDTDIGECENYTLKWYYHKQRNMCFQFWYGGCGGNKNRFETQEECDALCVVSP